MNIYVGNIGYMVSKEDLQGLFGKFGAVSKVKIMEDEDTGETAGWGFVTMENEEECERAVKALNLKVFKGRKLKVNKYRKKREDPFKAKFGEWIPK